MRKPKTLAGDARGAAALEFALVAPVFILLIIGIAQLGIIFLANAGLRSALGEGARFATLYPRPSAGEVEKRIRDTHFGLDPSRLMISPVTYGTSNSAAYATLSMSYTVNPEFVFVDIPPITLRQSRRVYIPPLPPS